VCRTVGFLVEQFPRIGRAIVMVAHDPTHPCTEFLRNGFDLSANPVTRLGFGNVSEVASEHKRVKRHLGGTEPFKQIGEVLLHFNP
jgi:hypothetical protein